MGLITFGEELLENKHFPYEGLAIETSNAQNATFSSKTEPLQSTQCFWKQNITKRHYLHGKH